MKQKYMFLMLQIHHKMMCALLHVAIRWCKADRAPLLFTSTIKELSYSQSQHYDLTFLTYWLEEVM